jgi:hypothetical protein
MINNPQHNTDTQINTNPQWWQDQFERRNENDVNIIFGTRNIWLAKEWRIVLRWGKIPWQHSASIDMSDVLQEYREIEFDEKLWTCIHEGDLYVAIYWFNEKTEVSKGQCIKITGYEEYINNPGIPNKLTAEVVGNAVTSADIDGSKQQVIKYYIVWRNTTANTPITCAKRRDSSNNKNYLDPPWKEQDLNSINTHQDPKFVTRWVDGAMYYTFDAKQGKDPNDVRIMQVSPDGTINIIQDYSKITDASLYYRDLPWKRDESYDIGEYNAVCRQPPIYIHDTIIGTQDRTQYASTTSILRFQTRWDKAYSIENTQNSSKIISYTRAQIWHRRIRNSKKGESEKVPVCGRLRQENKENIPIDDKTIREIDRSKPISIRSDEKDTIYCMYTSESGDKKLIDVKSHTHYTIDTGLIDLWNSAYVAKAERDPNGNITLHIGADPTNTRSCIVTAQQQTTDIDVDLHPWNTQTSQDISDAIS